MSDASPDSTFTWDRSQPWRQGSIISAGDCAKLDIFQGQPEGYLAAVISHDCDCVAGADVEANIEVIVANLSKDPFPNNMHAKNPRLFQLACKQSGQSIDLDIRVRTNLPKNILTSLQPEPTMRFSREERRILARWLASRYDRRALPDELQRRLDVVRDTIEKVGKAYPESIQGIYIYHDPDEELLEDQVYIVDIRVVYDHENLTARKEAEKAAVDIDARFKRKFYTGDNGIRPVWKEVELEHCSAVSDVEFSLFDVMSYGLWRLEHISLRQDPPADTIPRCKMWRKTTKFP
jgi:hypothetical protein